MRFGGRRSSDNVEYREGGGAGGGGGGGSMLLGLVFSRFGIVGVLLLAGVGYLVGGDPLGLSGAAGPQQTASAPAGRNAGQVCAANSTYRFACQTLASTEDQWTAMLEAVGRTYQPPKMVLYSRGAPSGCGAADSRMGPFYCPADRSLYLDTAFFDELDRRFAAPGDFAQAYVIAHEVGHHVQLLMGVEARVRRAQQGVSEAASNAIQVRMELQADCLAGAWAARERGAMEPGDLEEGMRAAAAIGDDTLQRAGTGTVVPESFTHGSSAQRQEALMHGYRGGSWAACEGYTAGL
jgi:predicted metalloprotease